MTWLARLDQRYRRTGANLPFGDPLPSHGAEMEGYFWRITDVRHHRVLVVLCGINRHPDGDWATVAIIAEPGGFVRSAVVPNAFSATDAFRVTAGNGALVADAGHVHVDLGPDATADFSLSEPVGWPRALGAGGVFASIPYLGQYWQPHLLGGVAIGTSQLAGEAWDFDGANVYAEKNWGAGFPQSWWWGQAQGFDRADVCVAFGGGVLTAGRLSTSVGGIVVRIGAHVVRIAPPFGRVKARTSASHWDIEGRGNGCRVHITGRGEGPPLVLPVPLPAERRNVDTDLQHLRGRLSLEVSGRVTYRGDSDLAGLEIGYNPTSSSPPAAWPWVPTAPEPAAVPS